MKIEIRNLRFDAIIGLLDFEREAKQPVVADLSIEYDYEDEEFLDYALVAELLVEHIRQERYELLEEALLGVERVLTERFCMMRTLECRLAKPHILPHAEVAVSKRWEYPQSTRRAER